MAQPTTPHPQQHQPMPATPGMAGTPGTVAQPLPPGTLAATAQQRVGQMGPPPPNVASGAVQTQATEGARPVLFDDIDPVLLCRLYPHSKSGDESRGLAEKAGEAAHEAGLKLVAAQQEPVAPETTAAPPAG